MGPDQFAQQIVQGGQVPVLVSEVVRGKALALVLERAKVVDESGRAVDLEALRERRAGRPQVDAPTTTDEPATRVTTDETADRAGRRAERPSELPRPRTPTARRPGPPRRPGDAPCADSEHRAESGTSRAGAAR